MLVLGISGGVDQVYQNRDYLVTFGSLHDAAAVLVDNGKVVAGIEEERLNRLKHTNKGAVAAIQFCLDSYGARLNDLDKLVLAGEEGFLTKVVHVKDFHHVRGEHIKEPRELIQEMLYLGLGEYVDDNKLQFIPHHLAHAVSAYAQSGFDKSLVVTLDGSGDDCSGMIINAQSGVLNLLHKISYAKSLGAFYLNVTKFLGYELFDEYKVMGLAPYGDPAHFRAQFKSFYELLTDGEYRINLNLPDSLAGMVRPRKKKEPFLQEHKDIAAALQESLEDIISHVLRHYRKETGQKRICMAGGVSHNCTFTGKLMYSGIFEDVFVQPAADDAGLAVGAALHSSLTDQAVEGGMLPRIQQVFWGRDIGSSEAISRVLVGWKDFLDFEYSKNIIGKAARLLAEGSVIGWMQGRSEFGPRALGNRSILADPRPPSNKDLINSMVKKREAYRPFAPAVIEEAASDFFDLPAGATSFPFMTFVVKVREDKRALLGATTHVDGTARLQTVSKQTNPRFWGLINEFGEQTGVPVLLNTSFNNNVEPIVETVNDGVVTFLTTKLDYLVVGDYLVSKKEVEQEQYLGLVPGLPLYVTLNKTKKFISRAEMETVFEIGNSYSSDYNVEITSKAFDLLSLADGKKPLDHLLNESGVIEEDVKRLTIGEILELWSRRVITLNPR